MLSNRANINRYKKNGEKKPCILLGHCGLKLEFNKNTNCRKPTNLWKLNNAQMNHPWVKVEIKEENKSFLEFNENESTKYPNSGKL